MGEHQPGPADALTDEALLERVRHAVAGQFDVAGALGRGGMAAVFLARDLYLDRQVAIKVMLPEVAGMPGMAQRFLREARTLAQLHRNGNHPNVIEVHTVAAYRGMPYFVMRFVDGAALDRVRQHEPRLPIAHVQRVLADVMEALRHAHGLGVVHRDIKPSNVLLSRGGTAIVTDFGIARAADDESLTMTGALMGTPAYMSPEHWTGETDVSARSDQYALGVLAFELLGGSLPFRGNLLHLQWAHVHERPPELAELRPDCPAELARTVMRMLEKRPADRFPSLEDALPVVRAGLPDDDRAIRGDLGAIAAAAAQEIAALGARTPRSPVPRAGLPDTVPGRGDVPAPPSLRVMPKVVRLRVGAQGSVRVLAEKGSEAFGAGVRFDWTIADPEVATLRSAGAVARLTGRRPGQTTVRVTLDGAAHRSVPVVIGPAVVDPGNALRAPLSRRELLLGGVVLAVMAGIMGGSLYLAHRYAESAGDEPAAASSAAGAPARHAPPVPPVPDSAATADLPAAATFDQPLPSQRDGGAAARTFQELLTLVRASDTVNLRRFVARGAASAAIYEEGLVLLGRGGLVNLSVRQNDLAFTRAVDRAMHAGHGTLPFTLTMRRWGPVGGGGAGTADRVVHLTAIIDREPSGRSTVTRFRLDSLGAWLPPGPWVAPAAGGA